MKHKLWIGVLVAIILIVIVVFVIQGNPTKENERTVQRALAAKMLALTLDSTQNLGQTSLTELGISDVQSDNWYASYVAKVIQAGLMQSVEGQFLPMDALSNQAAFYAYDAMGLDRALLTFTLKENEMNKSISPDQWYEMYDLMTQSNTAISQQTLFLFGSPSNISELGSWECLTDQGKYMFYGLALDNYMDYQVNAYIRDGEIIAVKSLNEEGATLTNVWIVKAQEKEVTIFSQGYYRTFKIQKALAQSTENVLGTLTFEQQSVQELQLKPTVIKGEILAVGENTITVKNYGELTMLEPFKVYKLYEGLAEMGVEILEIGNRFTEFVVEGNFICGALLRAETEEPSIRVILNKDGYTGYEHSQIQITSDVPFTTICNEVITEYPAGEVLTIDTVNEQIQNADLCVQTSTTDGKLTVLTLNRNQGNPVYRGKLYIHRSEQGLWLINELLLEEYLYGVIPSEMPASYEAQALMTQAICARSFATKAIEQQQLSDYGADVDDSVSTQVYNNNAEDERANAAVDATRGEVLKWQGEVVTTYFFSTSCGSTASPGDVWLSSESIETYMQGHIQVVDGEDADLSSEEAFCSFIDNYADIDYFEKDVSWFRWTVDVSNGEIKTALEKNLLNRSKAVPGCVLIKNSSGEFVAGEISSVGDILSVNVAARSTSGILKAVTIEGSSATIMIMGEYNIRLLLAPQNGVVCDDGTKTGAASMLPSGFFYLTAYDGGYRIRGGGYGHGTGMSQNGVQQLALRGLNYQQILEHYFSGTQVELR